MREAAKNGDGWRVPPKPTPPDTSPADVEWLSRAPRRTCRSNVSRQQLKLQNGALTLPRSYIYATRIAPADTFGRFSRMTKNEPAWRYFEIDASHSPNVTAPEALMALLQKIAGNRSSTLVMPNLCRAFDVVDAAHHRSCSASPR